MEHTYLNFQIHHLSEIEENKQIDSLITISIMNYAKDYLKKYDPGDVSRQIAYLWYRNPEGLPRGIFDKISAGNHEKYDYAFHNQDYYGFDSQGAFNPVDEINALAAMFEADKELLRECETVYQFYTSAHILGIKPGYLGRWEKYRFIDISTHKCREGAAIYAAIRKDLIFDAMEGRIPLDLFRLAVAVRSVLGRNSVWKKTYKSVLLPRMFGCRNEKETEGLTGALKIEYQAGQRRRYWDNLMKACVDRGLFYMVPGRGYYVSVKLNTEQLVEAVAEYQIEKKKKQETPKQMLQRKRKELEYEF